MALGAWGLGAASVPLLLGALFCLGTHSTVFGPIKYALLPAAPARRRAGRRQRADRGRHVSRDSARHDPRRQPRARRQRRAHRRRARRRSARIGGWLSARQIPLGAAVARRRAATHPPAARHDRRRRLCGTSARRLLLPILATRGSGCSASSSCPACRSSPRTCSSPNEQVVTLMLALFAIGVGVGSILAERLLHGEVSARYVPGRGLAMALLRDRSVSWRARAVPATAILAGRRRVPRPVREAGASSPTSSASRWPAGSSPCRSTRCCSTRASRATARASSPPTTSSTRCCMTGGAPASRRCVSRAPDDGRAVRLCAASRRFRWPSSRRGSCAARSSRGVMRVVLRLLYRVRGRRPRARPRGDAACGDRRQPRLVPRRPAARRVPARRPDLRGRHVHRQEVVGAGRSCRWSTRCRSIRPIRCRFAR